VDLDEEMKKKGIGGVEIGNIRIWNLAYADDIVLLAKNRIALTDMMDNFRRFLKNKEIELSVNKTRIMIFNRKEKEKKEMEGQIYRGGTHFQIFLGYV